MEFLYRNYCARDDYFAEDVCVRGAGIGDDFIGDTCIGNFDGIDTVQNLEIHLQLFSILKL